MQQDASDSKTLMLQGGVQGLIDVLESISDAFFALDHAWRFTYLNSAAERLLMRSRAELLGRDVWKEFPSAVGTAFDVQYRRAVAQQATVEFEEFYPPLDTWFAVRAYPTPTGLSVYFQDASDRRRAQAAVRESEERAREVAERLGFALAAAELGDWDWDAASDVLRLSPRALEIFGVSASPGMTRTAMREMVDLADRERARLALEEAPSNQGRYQIEYRFNRPDGKQVWVSASGRSRYDAEGHLTGMTGVVQDITYRKTAETDLKDYAARYERQSRLFEQVASSTPDFIYVFDVNSRVVYANRRLLEVWGTTQERAVGKTLYELGYPTWHADMHVRELQQVIRMKQPVKGEVPFTGASGIAGVYEYIFTPVIGPDGQVEVIGGTTRDVTDRKRVEQEAQAAKALAEASLNRWQAIVGSMDEGVVLIDRDGNILDMNHAALKMHGYQQVEEIRKPLREIAPVFEIKVLGGQALPFEQWPIPRLLRGESFSKFEVRLLRADKGMDLIVSYSGTIIKDAEDKIILCLLTLHDVTQERRAERYLRESESQFREMFEQTPIGMTLNELNGRYVHANPAYCQIVGRTREELLDPSLDFRELIYPEDRPKMLKRQSQLLEGEIPAFFIEKRYVRPDGSAIWVRVTGTVRRDAQGKAMHFVRLVENIDDRKRAEVELAQLLESERAARTDAERASSMKDEFLATLSHELRTPLNAILGWSQILAGGTRDDEDLAEGLQIIERNARAQTQIIEDLLDMSRIISGKVRLDVQRVELAPLVQAAIGTIRPAADAKEIRLVSVLDPLAGPVSGDPSRLQQVFWNLLTNAVKFTPRGGRVQVLLERVNSHLEISVIDTGEGIRPEFLPHVFDRFRQSDASTTRNHGGLGLGLAIVKQLVELHGGTVRAKSPGPGRGSTFVVALPLTVIHAETVVHPDRRHPTVGGVPIHPNACAKIAGVRVLVVDDEHDARGLIKRLLEDCKAKVTVAATAGEAFSLVQRSHFDILVSDIGMPGEDGYSLIRRIRGLPAHGGGDLPAVALTAYARSADRVQAVVAGFQQHIAKPVEPAELITIVASLARPQAGIKEVAE